MGIDCGPHPECVVTTEHWWGNGEKPEDWWTWEEWYAWARRVFAEYSQQGPSIRNVVPPPPSGTALVGGGCSQEAFLVLTGRAKEILRQSRCAHADVNPDMGKCNDCGYPLDELPARVVESLPVSVLGSNSISHIAGQANTPSGRCTDEEKPHKPIPPSIRIIKEGETEPKNR